ncbi:MAG: DUF4062 domain-containing protein, partial [Terriglobia bacterium]
MDTPQQPKIGRTEVFISAASSDLKTTRSLVKRAVDTIGCHGVYQEEFPPDYRTVEAMLRSLIENCDAVIHVAGVCYGSEPRDRPSDKTRRSYTQMEYDIARELGRPLYVFVCSETFPYDSHQQEPDDVAALQKAHRDACLGRPEIREKVDSTSELEKRVSQLQDHLRKLERQLLDTSKAVKEVGEKIEATSEKRIRAKLKLAETLVRQGKRSEGIRELEEALVLAQDAKLAEEEVEVLLALGMFSSSRRRGIGTRRGYFDQAEKKIEEIKNATVRVLFFRTKSAVCHDERNRKGAEEALRAALECCENAKDDDEKNLETQACAVRSELIILLCELDRHAEATELVAACDAH